MEARLVVHWSVCMDIPHNYHLDKIVVDAEKEVADYTSSSSYEKEEHGVVVLPEPHVGSLLGSQTEVEATEEENEIEFAVDESLKQAELFVQDGPEHTIDFTQPEVDEDDEDEFSVGQILGSVNDPSTNGYSNDHDLGTPRSHRSVEV